MRGSESVELVKLGPPDAYGDRTELSRVVVGGCIIWPRQLGDHSERGVVIISGLHVFLPPDTDVDAVDRVEARGEEYEVEGVPGDYRTAAGQKKGIWAVLKRVGE